MLTPLFTAPEKLHQWIAGAGSDSTLVIPISRHHNVTFHSPAGPPRVFHQPVVVALISTITNYENTMVQLSAATRPNNRTIQILASKDRTKNLIYTVLDCSALPLGNNVRIS